MPSRLGAIVLLVVWIAQLVSVAPMTGAGVGFFESTAWMQVEDWRVLIVYQAQRLALGQRCRRGRGRRRCIRRIRQRRRRLRQGVIVWRRLKPVLEELVAAEMGCQAGGVSGFRLPVQVVVVTPDYSQTVCPECSGPTKCKRSYYIHPQDIHLEQPTVLQVYREVRECRDERCKARIAPELDFVTRENASPHGLSRKPSPRSPRTVCRWSACGNA